MLAAPIQASPLRNPCDDDAVARETTAACAGPLPPPSAASVANAVRGTLNTRIAVAATTNTSIDVNISVLLINS